MYKLTKQGKTIDNHNFWLLEKDVTPSKDVNEDVEYIDIPSSDEFEKAWIEKIKLISKKLK